MAGKVTPGVGRRRLIQREIGRQNRVVMPPEVLEALGVGEGDFVEFELRDREVVLHRLRFVRDDPR